MDPGGQEDPALLVVVRQSLVLTFVLLGIFAICLSRHGSVVHLWLEGSWWLVTTTLVVFLFIQGLFQMIKGDSEPLNVMILGIMELVELGLYLVLAVFANMGRKRPGKWFALARLVFWVATIMVVVLWSVSSLISIVTSGRATPGTIITMSATVVAAVLMLADLCVTSWHGMNSTVTVQRAEDEAHEPLMGEEPANHRSTAHVAQTHALVVDHEKPVADGTAHLSRFTLPKPADETVV